ncbi:MAG: hypothetical protein ABJC12_13605, partial [Saprospiraceae bacterium]
MKFFSFIFIIIIIEINESYSQTFYACGGLLNYWNLELNTENCFCSNCGCSISHISSTNNYWDGISVSPEGNLFGYDNDIYEINKLTGQPLLYFNVPPGTPWMAGIVAIGNGIFYSMSDTANAVTAALYRIDVNLGTAINLGYTGIPSKGDMTMFDGNLYYPTIINPNSNGIVKVDMSNPSNSYIIVTYPSSYAFFGLTATRICNTLLTTDLTGDEIDYINLLDGAIIPICDAPHDFWFMTSQREFEAPTICNTLLDLDCNDSSGASDADYNSHDYDCLSSGVKITDTDIGMQYDAIISTMTIHLVGFIPDAPNEILMMNGSIAGINVFGSGTSMITLTNAGGAKSTDFKDALRLIVYKNTAIPLTPGLRTVEVQFTTESGSQSNIATAFIDVISLPYVDVDLGPDLQKCDGQTATFNAGNPGAAYVWNTGSHSQSITTGNSGQYIVTVSNGIECPTQDTVELDIIPVIHVSLTGGTEICDNEHANMTIVTDSPFPLDVEITRNPGSSFTLTGVQGTYPFFDLPSITTTYTITSVTPSQDACVTITNPTEVFYVYPTYVSSTAASICQGDSIWLGYYWENQAGTYEILFNSEYGCDSTVTFTIDVLPAVNISATSTTCLPAEAGIFITHIDNPNGCDTVLTTTVTLLPSDTTHLSLSSCNISNAGVTTQTLTNQAGCDSVIITTTSWIPPMDTTEIFQTTCDSLQLGIFQQILPAQSGCDSLIITTVGMALSDTTYLFGVSCDSNEISVHLSLYSNLAGCDSLVITTVTAGVPDTSFILKTSCDPASLGVFETHFNNHIGCDSTVFTTVTFSAQDSTFIFNTTCDPGEVSTLISHYTNQFGCDSIVTQIVSLLPSDQTFVNSTTCDS